jgi:hypothetical protein
MEAAHLRAGIEPLAGEAIIDAGLGKGLEGDALAALGAFEADENHAFAEIDIVQQI